MSNLLDSSELREAARLIAALLRPADPAASAGATPAKPAAAPPGVLPPITPSASLPTNQAPVPVQPTASAPAAPVPPVADIEAPTFGFRGERLEHALAGMCRRGGLNGAVIADRRGFALAVHNSPVDDDAMAAFTTVLGDALEKAANLLGEHGAETIAMDINYLDKVVLRRFRVDGQLYYLMVLCPQQVDERSEIEISIDQITRILLT